MTISQKITFPSVSFPLTEASVRKGRHFFMRILEYCQLWLSLLDSYCTIKRRLLVCHYYHPLIIPLEFRSKSNKIPPSGCWVFTPINPNLDSYKDSMKEIGISISYDWKLGLREVKSKTQKIPRNPSPQVVKLDFEFS